MSKKKDKAGRKAGKLPKQVAGFKLPKEVRKSGEALIARATSPSGQAAIAQGLTVAAGLATMAAERSARAAPRPAGAAGEAAPSPTPPIDPAKVVEAVGTVATVVFGRLFATKA